MARVWLPVLGTFRMKIMLLDTSVLIMYIPSCIRDNGRPSRYIEDQRRPSRPKLPYRYSRAASEHARDEGCSEKVRGKP